MKRFLSGLLGGALGLLLVHGAQATVNAWDPSVAPLATGVGNQVARAMAISSDGATLFLGTGSGTVFRMAPATVPGPPIIVSASAGDGQATVSFTTPVSTGHQAITAYLVTSSPGSLTASCSASPCTVTGLANGTSYTFTVAASNSVGTGLASASSNSVTPLTLVNGSCGNAQGTASLLPPAGNLCLSGSAGAVSNASPWTWNCVGAGGGSTASCAAPNAATSTGSGVGRLVLNASSGANAWQVQAASFAAVTSTGTSGPPNVNFPHGLLNLNLNQGTANSTASVTVTYPSALPQGSVYWKYGKTLANPVPHWYVFAGAVISGATVTLTLTDGGAGDDDLTGNGVIVDPGGVGVPVDLSITGVPALSLWRLGLLGFGLMALGLLGVRRKSVQG